MLVRWRLAPLAAVACAAATLGYAACGGKAVIDAEDGAGGSGGAPSGPGPGPGPGQGGSAPTGPTTTNVGVGGGSLCQQACSLVDQCLASPGDCVARCSDELLCPESHDGFLHCLIDELDTSFPCDLPDDCIVELQTFLDCNGVESFEGTCTEENGVCTCDVVDHNDNSYQTKCDTDANGTLCECVANGVPQGSCLTPAFKQCSPIDDCCATLFFLP
jgi:hypothetical protein